MIIIGREMFSAYILQYNKLLMCDTQLFAKKLSQQDAQGRQNATLQIDTIR